MRPHHEGQPVIEHPNRAKASSKTTRAVVFVLLLASIGLMLLVLIGGWNSLSGMQFVTILWIAVYGLFAWYVVRWNRGVLPVIAALSINTISGTLTEAGAKRRFLRPQQQAARDIQMQMPQ